MKTVLITGVAGFVGANLSRYLLGRGYKVYGIDNFSSGDINNIPDDVHIIWGSITHEVEMYFTKEILKEIDCIVHLAADSGVKPSVDDPYNNANENIMGTIRMLEFARKYNIKRFVFASSGGTILGAQKPPVHEESPIKPISPYGASKAACEHYCNAYYETFGIETIILRFSNVYGPYSLHKPKNLIPAFILSCLNDEKFVINGDGGQTRDFIYIKDLIRAIGMGIERDDLKNETFQIATGMENSINWIVNYMNNEYNKISENTLDIDFGPEQIGDVRRNFASTQKAGNILGWVPEYSVEMGIKELFKFYLG